MKLRPLLDRHGPLLVFGTKVVAVYQVWFLLYDLWLAGSAGLRVVDGCNGLSSIGLFVGFVLAYPGRWSRRLGYVPLGMAVVYATNVARVARLAVLQGYWPAGFDLVYGLGAAAIFYLVIFVLWVGWVHFGQAGISRRTWQARDARSTGLPAHAA